MKKAFLLAVAFAISAPAALAAQGDAPKPGAAPAAAATASPEETANVQRAVVILRTFNLAFQSKEVQQPVKGQLLRCLYNNTLSAISTATKRVLDQNPSLKADDAGVVYRVAAGVCGIAFKRTDGAADPGAAAVPGAPGAPPKAPGKTEGR